MAVSVIVLCDGADESRTRDLFCHSATEISDVLVVGLVNGPGIHRRIREHSSLHRGALFVNFCVGNAEDDNRADAAQVAQVLESNGVCFAGCPAATQGHSRGILCMMVFYANVPQQSFVEIEDVARDVPLIRQLALPVVVESSDPHDGASRVVADSHDAAVAAVSEGLATHRKLMVTEVAASPSFTSSFAVVGLGRNAFRLAGVTNNFPKVQEYGKAIAANVLNHRGYCVVDVAGERDAPRVTRIRAGCSALALGAEAVSVVTELAQHVRQVWKAAQRNYVVTYDPTDKGYHLRAARNISKGEIVFHDEMHTFSIVTKPFVDANWDDELKHTFSRFAWPLDTEGHVYAIWEEDPKRWRPINHSCDPNCINAAPHSLNVVASRDIAKGDDLAMDYSTFCDSTMKPFTCLCGTASCRGEIKMEARHLTKYGENTWLRKPPPGVV
jgi:hypothetical protein